MRGVYVDYRMRRVTSFDVFNDLFGNYSGPMLSDLLKKKGIKPPRKLVDRIQILVDAIDDKMRSTYIDAFSEVTKRCYQYWKGVKQEEENTELTVNTMFHLLLPTIS
ncbi:hypothetical protein WA588_006023 [Blastocystis sp. NMH]